MQLICNEPKDEPAAALLRQTVDAHQELLHWLDGNVPPEHSHDLVVLHRHFYEAARKQSGLQARAVTLAMKDFVQRRRGKIVEGAPLDEKLYGLKGIELVSIATLNGRVTIPFRVAGYALAEAVKPLEKIGEVRIIDMGGGGLGGTLAGGGSGGGKADSLVDALLAYRAQSPVIDSLLKEAGFTAGGNPVTSLISAAKANGAVAPADETPKH